MDDDGAGLPERTALKYDWQAWAKKARRNKGRWIITERQVPRAYPNQLKKGQLRAFRSDVWTYRMAARNTSPDGLRADIWLIAERVAEPAPPTERSSSNGVAKSPTRRTTHRRS